MPILFQFSMIETDPAAKRPAMQSGCAQSAGREPRAADIEPPTGDIPLLNAA
jgi:hypothetical protein